MFTVGPTASLMVKFKARQNGTIKKVAFWCSSITSGATFGVELLDAQLPSGPTSDLWQATTDVLLVNAEGETPIGSGNETANIWDFVNGDPDEIDHPLGIPQTSGWTDNIHLFSPGFKYICNNVDLTGVVGASDRIESVWIDLWAGLHTHGSGPLDLILYQNSAQNTINTVTVERLVGKNYTGYAYQSPVDGVPWTPAMFELLDTASTYGWGFDSSPAGWGQFLLDTTLNVDRYTTDNRLDYDYDLSYGATKTTGEWVEVTLDTGAAVTAGTDYYLHLWAVSGTYQVPIMNIDGSSWPVQVDTCVVNGSGIPTTITANTADRTISAFFKMAEETRVAASGGGNKVTITEAGHSKVIGQIVTLSEYDPAAYDGTHEIESVDTNDYDVDIGVASAAYVSGGTVTPFMPGELNFPCAEIDAQTVESGTSVDFELTTPAGKTVSVVSVYLKADSNGPNAPLIVDVHTALDGDSDATPETSGTLKTSEVSLSTTVWTKVNIPITPYVTSADELFLYFQSDATSGYGWLIHSIDTRSDEGGTDLVAAPTTAEIDRMGWTGTRDDAGNDSVDGDSRYDHAVQLVVAPRFYHPYEAFLRGLSNTQGLWFLDETSETVATDSSSNTNTGTYVNSPTLGVAGPLEAVVRPNNAVTFAKASDEAVTVVNDATLRPGTGDFSFGCWMKPTDDSSTRYVVGLGGVTQADTWALNIDTVDFFRLYIGSTLYQINVAATLNLAAGAWQRLICNMDRDGNWEVFINGVSGATKDISGSSATDINESVTVFALANEGNLGTSNEYDGGLAYCQYRSALWTSAEIAEDYAFLSDLTLVTPTIGTTAVRP